jgi:hypothetical protein
MAFTAAEKRDYRLYASMMGMPVRGGEHKPWHKGRRESKVGERIYIGVDTEGETHDNGHHYTTMIAYSDKTGEHSKVLRAEPGSYLSSRDLLEFVASIPENCTPFSYSFGYDISKIVQDLPNELIYKLVRPHTREAYAQAFMGRKPVKWKGFRVNLDNLRFTVGTWPEGGKKKQVAVWDMIRFCQCPFVAREDADGKVGKRGALEMWNIGTQEERDIIRRMKTKRDKFTAEELDEIESYTLLECRKMAELAEAIINAHKNLRTPSIPDGLHLKRFDGPGSTVTALFRNWGLVDYFKELKAQFETYAPNLVFAIKCAYFGGRFENSRIGHVKHGWNKDINSAYPYQICGLPCLLHGRWRKTKSIRHARTATIAIVQYRLKKHPANCKYWGPLPIRMEDGCICYPEASGGGWIYRDEFFTAFDSGLWPGLEFAQAWVYERTCVCDNPLRHLAELYQERDRVGKETGEGQVLKLGPNSCYGKMAQTVGEAPFQSWVYAGLITSGCRTQALEALIAHEDPRNLLAIATDGILTLEDVRLPDPKPTGAEKCKKPLGGWDSDEVHNIFIIRPGMSVGTKLKTRGVSAKVLAAVADAIMSEWDTNHNANVSILAPNETRFIGARQGVYFVPRTREYRRRDEYGDWYTRPQTITLNPIPKRERALKDGTLILRNMAHVRSVPYYKGALDTDGLLSPKEQLELEELDQPDGYDEQVYE